MMFARRRQAEELRRKKTPDVAEDTKKDATPVADDTKKVTAPAEPLILERPKHAAKIDKARDDQRRQLAREAREERS
jgi:hypothetical protein